MIEPPPQCQRASPAKSGAAAVPADMREKSAEETTEPQKPCSSAGEAPR